MALTDKVKLQAQAGQLGIVGYRTMSLDQLTKAIKTASTASTPPKGKTPAANGNGAAPKGKTAEAALINRSETATGGPPKGKVSAPPAKGKTTTSQPAPKGKTAAAKAPTSAPAAQSTAQKSSPPKGKGTAAPGKVERPTAGKGKTAATPAAKATPQKGKTTTTAATPRKRAAKATTGTVESFKSTIDNKAVNWKAESTVGLSGKRKDVLDALRKFKGDKAKAFEELKENAVKWYPNAMNSYPTAPTKKHAAERMLVWLIGKVAYDFVKKTGQHQDGTRVAYGQSTNPKHLRRRTAREEAQAARGTAAPATPAKGRTTSPARKPAAQKPAQARGKPQAAPVARGKAAVGKGKTPVRGKR